MPLPLLPQEVVQGIPRLPAFPKIIQNVIRALDDEDSSMNALADLLQRDPVITGKVLATANQLLRGDRRDEVRGIFTAVSLVGQRKIREIALTASLADLARKNHASAHFWEHSLAVAIAAQELALQVGDNADYAFIAGLLHDIGQLWLAHFYPGEFETVRTRIAQERVPTCEAEQAMFGMHHGEIGRLVGEHWGLPKEIVLAIGEHHRADGPVESRLLAVTHVAEVLCNALDIPSRPSNQVSHLSDTAVARAGIDWLADITALFGRIEARFAFARTMLH